MEQYTRDSDPMLKGFLQNFLKMLTVQSCNICNKSHQIFPMFLIEQLINEENDCDFTDFIFLSIGVDPTDLFQEFILELLKFEIQIVLEEIEIVDRWLKESLSKNYCNINEIIAGLRVKVMECIKINPELQTKADTAKIQTIILNRQLLIIQPEKLAKKLLLKPTINEKASNLKVFGVLYALLNIIKMHDEFGKRNLIEFLKLLKETKIDLLGDDLKLYLRLHGLTEYVLQLRIILKFFLESSRKLKWKINLLCSKHYKLEFSL